ncbi:hypothetical protein BU14_0260s0026 [Porphyra umbilicalis]|uniref:RNA polymerase Rpb4/RPC9 core domain-containing protein n=1 Tax=Porphyra umbilicalis TaxID=2786 RepID=A0A1X6P2B4_PORUM|nr:hypothetical protein BU14_0260s0026 [Porphyra umbilicalis]|eukprot:OSX74957.1 hypothetical protein BU14_0260s0026 [Porphyra umbilicalis]
MAQANGTGNVPSSLPGAVAASAAASATAAARDEDAAQLRLGVMEGEEVLMISEAAALLAKREADHAKLGHTYSLDVVNGLFRPAATYCARFDRIQNKTAVLAVRDTFDGRGAELGLHPFEVAQLVNLMPADAEEAKAIIPSLREEGKIDNDVLNGLLMELTTFAK